MPLFCWFDHIFNYWAEIWQKNSYYLKFARLILRLFMRFLMKSSRVRILNTKLLSISLVSKPILRLFLRLFTRLILRLFMRLLKSSGGCIWNAKLLPISLVSRLILRLFLRLFTRLILRLFIRFLKSSRARILNTKLLPISRLSRPIFEAIHKVFGLVAEGKIHFDLTFRQPRTANLIFFNVTETRLDFPHTCLLV